MPKSLSSCYSYKAKSKKAPYIRAQAAEKRGSLHVCADNNDLKAGTCLPKAGVNIIPGSMFDQVVCDLKQKVKFVCEKCPVIQMDQSKKLFKSHAATHSHITRYVTNVSNTTTHSDGLVIDGLEYYQIGAAKAVTLFKSPCGRFGSAGPSDAGGRA